MEVGFGGGECEVEIEIEKNGESMGDMGEGCGEWEAWWRYRGHEGHGGHGGNGDLWDIGVIGEMEETLTLTLKIVYLDTTAILQLNYYIQHIGNKK